MKKDSWLLTLYKKLIIDQPLLSLLAVIIITVVAATQLPKFRLDASSESLVLENDDSIHYYRQVAEQYTSDDFLIITWQPHKGLMDVDSLAAQQELVQRLEAIQTVANINSILNVPLLDGLTLDTSSLSEEIPTLSSLDVDKEKALAEFTSSPLYKDLLVGADGSTSAIQINFLRDEQFYSLLDARDVLRQQALKQPLTSDQQTELSNAEQAFDDYSRFATERTSQIITDVRLIMKDYDTVADLHLGGISMITNDMLDYIQHDITVFGIGIILFIMFALMVFFGKIRWVILPLFACLTTVITLAGLLSFLDWRITVISSNFPAILLIVILALNVHLVVYYRDLIAKRPELDKKDRVFDTVRTMFWPCFYTAITTIVAFISLLISGIRPVIDFGWIMTMGVALGFVMTFVIFPSVLQLMKKDAHKNGQSITFKITNWISNFTDKRRAFIYTLSVALLAFSVYGISQLKVENRFIDYFKPSTEIYQGMTIIDQKLGGTTPLDIVIDADASQASLDDEFNDEFADEFEDDAFEEDEFAEDGLVQPYEAGYWFTASKLQQLEKIHDYIDSIGVTGKVQSIATTSKILQKMNGGAMPDQLTLNLVHQKLPDDVKTTLLAPYLSSDGNQTRINIRVQETDHSLKRSELIAQIRDFIVNETTIKPENVHFTGMLVLYNNMLQSLFDSQILTIGTVYIAILLMFLILFRSFALSVIATIPNLLSAAMVLGIMGWAGIAMDMMTITIAAIVIGIAVDNSIHYVHRFKAEFSVDGDYLKTMRRCHSSIGKAIYYTGVTIILGFGILTLSEFIPSIYFGLLTGLAMAVALFLNLTLLPLMIITLKPMKSGKK